MKKNTGAMKENASPFRLVKICARSKNFLTLRKHFNGQICPIGRKIQFALSGRGRFRRKHKGNDIPNWWKPVGVCYRVFTKSLTRVVSEKSKPHYLEPLLLNLIGSLANLIQANIWTFAPRLKGRIIGQFLIL